jgi:hypothetical protein
VIADLFNQFHDVAREEHRRSGAHEAGQQPPDHVGGHRVHALERLVEEQHRRVVD